MDNICKEGNLQLVFQDTNWTKIDSNAYADTCGKFSGLFDGFKLMDCSWFNRMTNTLWLIEVKQFYNPENPRHQDKDLQQQATINQLIGDLLQKSIATLLLLNERNKTSACFPEGATKAKDTKIASILIVKAGLYPLHSFINQKWFYLYHYKRNLNNVL